MIDKKKKEEAKSEQFLKKKKLKKKKVDPPPPQKKIQIMCCKTWTRVLSISNPVRYPLSQYDQVFEEDYFL